MGLRVNPQTPRSVARQDPMLLCAMRLAPTLLLLLAASLPAAVAAPIAPPEAVSLPAVALSPDAHTLAWAEKAGDRTDLHLATLPGLTGQHTLAPPSSVPCSSSNPVWSPDNSTLAFTSTCGAPTSRPIQEQIFLYTPSTGALRQLTHLAGNLDQLAFSPDSKALAFLFVENATRSAGALDAMKPWAGVIGEDNIEVQRVASVSVASGQLTDLTPPNLHTFEFSWAPDSRAVTFVGAAPPGENNWWIAKLYTQAAQPSATPTVVLDSNTVPGPLNGLQIAVPRFSPDGKSIAFLGGLMSDQGSTGGDLYLIPSTGGTPQDLTPNRPSTPTWFTWTAPHTLLVSEDAQATTHLFHLNTETGATETLLRYSGSLSDGTLKDALSVSTDGTVAAARSSFSDPPEIALLPPAPQPAHLQQITHLNDSLRATAPRTESLAWTNGGFHVQGWLTFPAHFDPHQHYPLIVVVHGGPSASVRSRWGLQTTFSDAGYFVLEPNPRGSFGQGERFTQANRKDFGYGDLHDILAGLDTVEKQQPVDPAREGLTGWSYGGFMTMFAVTQTHRFHAAVAGAGISDWQSYYGENSIDQWMTPFFGATVYNDPAIYAKSSAIDFIKNVTTPTLVIVGDRDGECPAPQSFEFWHALRAQNVPTQLVIYPAEGHRFKDPAHIADRSRRELAWFAKYLPAKDLPANSTQALSTAQNTPNQN